MPPAGAAAGGRSHPSPRARDRARRPRRRSEEHAPGGQASPSPYHAARGARDRAGAIARGARPGACDVAPGRA